MAAKDAGANQSGHQKVYEQVKLYFSKASCRIQGFGLKCGSFAFIRSFALGSAYWAIRMDRWYLDFLQPGMSSSNPALIEDNMEKRKKKT